MKENTREIIYVAALVGLGMGLSKVVWLLPFILLVPAILTYSVDNPLVYLVLLAVWAELYSVTPPGIASVAVFLPYLVKRAWRGGQVDVSGTFIGVLGGSILMQMMILFLPDVVRTQHWGVIPWGLMGPTVVLTTVTAFLTIVAVYYNRTW